MSSLDFHALLDALSELSPVRESDLIDHTHEVQIGDAVVSLQWDDTAQALALSVPVPMLWDAPQSATTQLMLYRALLERHWLEMGGEDGIGFGLIPHLGVVVGTAWLDTSGFTGGDDLLARLQQTLAQVEEAWYGVCALLIEQQAAEHTTPVEVEERASLGMHVHG